MPTPANALDITQAGLVVFDGTNSFSGVAAGSSGNIATSNGTTWVSTTPIVVQAYIGSDQTSVTGDGTNYVVAFSAVAYQKGGSNFNTGTGIFTCPSAGIYKTTVVLTLTSLTASHNAFQITIDGSAGTSSKALGNPGVIRDTSNNATLVTEVSGSYNTSDTIRVSISVSGSTKTVGLQGEFFGQYSYVIIEKIAGS